MWIDFVPLPCCRYCSFLMIKVWMELCRCGVPRPSKANLLTNLALGFCCAKLLTGFQFLDMVEFLRVAAIGFAGAFAIAMVRGRNRAS